MGVVSEDDNTILPVVNELLGNYPNPFNPETTIRFNVSEPGSILIEIYNVRGQRIRTLLNKHIDAGEHSIIWNGQDENGREVGSGIYLYIMRMEDFSQTQRMILMK